MIVLTPSATPDWGLGMNLKGKLRGKDKDKGNWKEGNGGNEIGCVHGGVAVCKQHWPQTGLVDCCRILKLTAPGSFVPYLSFIFPFLAFRRSLPFIFPLFPSFLTSICSFFPFPFTPSSIPLSFPASFPWSYIFTLIPHLFPDPTTIPWSLIYSLFPGDLYPPIVPGSRLSGDSNQSLQRF